MISLNLLSFSCTSGIVDILLNQAKTFGFSLLSIYFLCKAKIVEISLYIQMSATVTSSPQKNSYLYSFLSSMCKIMLNSSKVALISSYQYCFSPKACGPIIILISRQLVTLIIDQNHSNILSINGFTSKGYSLFLMGSCLLTRQLRKTKQPPKIKNLPSCIVGRDPVGFNFMYSSLL